MFAWFPAFGDYATATGGGWACRSAPRAERDAGVPLVRRVVPPTPLIPWPLLAKRAGAEVWVKHENHTPIGAFKVRGGLVYMQALKREQPGGAGVIAATR